MIRRQVVAALANSRFLSCLAALRRGFAFVRNDKREY
jgi:hypothetical protein